MRVLTPQVLEIPKAIGRAALRELEGHRPSDRHFDSVIDSDTDIYDPEDGRLVLRFRKQVLKADCVHLARRVFGHIDEQMRPSYVRRSAAGFLDLERVREFRADVVAIEPIGTRKFAGTFVLKNGRRLKDSLSNPVKSFMAGYNYNRYRMIGAPTGFSRKFPEEWQRALPFFEDIGGNLDALLPTVSKVMHAWCVKTAVAPNFTIGNTCLSTVAVNVNYDSCFHFDRGDLPEGYSTLTALAVGGSYKGGLLVLPQYRVAIDVRNGDLLCNQSHRDLHGNTEVVSQGAAKRISFVTYLKKTLKNARNGLSSDVTRTG